MIGIHRSQVVGSNSGRSLTRYTLLAIFGIFFIASIVPSVAQAAFDVSGLTVTSNTKQASAHPSLTIAFNSGNTNSDDLRDLTIDFPVGFMVNPEAAVSKCSSTQFASDICPSASAVGDLTANANLEVLGFSYPVTVNGSIYVLSPSGLEHAALGYVLRPSGYAKSFSKQAFVLRPDSDGGAKTITTNQLRAQTLSWPRVWGATNIAIRKLTLRINNRANPSKTGPYFTMNQSACAAASLRISASSYASESDTALADYTATGCSSVTFLPTMGLSVDNTSSGEFTAASFNMDLPQSELTIQQSPIKSVSALLPVGTGLNSALLGTYGAGCQEAELLASSCPETAIIGSASAVLPHFPPSFDGVVYLMEPLGPDLHGAVVLGGPRNMRSIIRFTNSVQGSGSSARVLSTWDYVPHVPFSRISVYLSEPLLKNPACPGAMQTASVTFTSYSNRTRTVAPSYATSCTATTPSPPVITSPLSGTWTSDSTPTFSGTAQPGATVNVYDGAVGIGTAMANAAGNWTFTPASSIGSGVSSITSTATAGAATSTTSAAVSITVDTVAPLAPVVTTDAGATKDNTPTFGGTAEEGSIVIVRDGAVALGSSTADSTGIWSFTPAALPDGTYSISTTATDRAANEGSASTTQTVIIDTVVPATPSITSPAAGSTIGDSTPVIEGGAESGTSVRVTRGGNVQVCIAVANSSGAWSCEATVALPDGAYSITAVATDAAGNASAASGSVSFTVSPVVPIQITTGPQGGLPIDITHWDIWYQGGISPINGLPVSPHQFPQWSFSGSASSTYECSLQLATSADSFSPCTSPFIAPFESLSDADQAGTEYRFMVRYAGNPTVSDSALFQVGPYDPTWDVALSSNQALGHPDMSFSTTSAFGDPMSLYVTSPQNFWGSLDAVSQRCAISSANAGTCSAAAPNSKIGTVTLTAIIDPNPHNDTVSPHSITRTSDLYLTPPTRTGDAAGLAISIRLIDDAIYGSRDYGTINYVGRMKLRYSENLVHPDEIEHSYVGVGDPTGFDLVFDEIPNSSLAATGITPGPNGAADMHIRTLSATILGDAAWYDTPFLWNDSQCVVESEFRAFITSSSFAPFDRSQPYLATGCNDVEYSPTVSEFSASDNGATDLVNDLNIGVAFPDGGATTRSLIIDLPREFVENPNATSGCETSELTVADPQAACPDSTDLGSVTATSPIFPNALEGHVLAENVSGPMPSLYMVFQDPDVGLDMRIRGSLTPHKTGTSDEQADGDFIRAVFNVGGDGASLELPGLPLSSLSIHLHQENAGVVLPDSTVSDGPIIGIGTGSACNSTGSARFIFQALSGKVHQVSGPPLAFNCGANGQQVAGAIDIVSGPANGATINTDSVSFGVRNNHSTPLRLRTGIDDSTSAISSGTYDSGIEPNTAATQSTAAGATRNVTFTGLQHNTVYKFLVQNNGSGSAADQERRTFKVELLTGPPEPPVINTPVNGSITNSNIVAISGTSNNACTIVVYDGAAALGSTTASTDGTWSFVSNALSDGQHTFTARCLTSGGFQSELSGPHSVTVDTIPPAAPVITSPTDAQIGSVTNVVGNAEPGSTVTVREGASVVCTATSSGGGGWMCGPGGGFSAGNHVVCATATDAAGNTGVPECVQFGSAADAKARVLTGPEGGLPIVITHDINYYNAGHEYPEWTFKGGGSGATYECSLVKAVDPDSFATCASPLQTPFEGLDDSVASGTDYRFRVRIAGLPSSVDTALFKVGQFNPAWSVGLTTLQALGHPDLTATVSTPFGDAKRIRVASPDYFMGSLSANPVKCSIESAQAGTCASTAPVSKIGTLTFTADVNPNPHNDLVPPHSVTRTFDAFLTPALQPGDAAGIAMSIRAVDDPAYGSLDYGTINYIARMKLRYDGPGGEVSYDSVMSPLGMDMIMENIPTSSLPALGVTPGPAGATDLHVRGVTMHVIGSSYDYASPLLYNSSNCTTEGAFAAVVTSGADETVTRNQPYMATGCDNIEYEPSVIQFGVSDNGATDLINDITMGVFFPEGNATTRNAIIDMPREFVSNLGAVQTCPVANLLVQDPQENCADTSNLGTATATSPLLPYSLVGEVFAEDLGGTMPNIYMVFKDPDIGLDTRIRGSLAVLKTGTGVTNAKGDFIRTNLNLFQDGSTAGLPSLPMTSLVVTLHSEDPGTVLPDGTVSLGPIVKVGAGYVCNETASARLILKAWNGVVAHLVSPPVNFDCAANSQIVASELELISAPANSDIVTTDSVTLQMKNNYTLAARLRIGLDDGTNAEGFIPVDAEIEPNTIPTTSPGGTRTVNLTGLEDGKVYKLIVQMSVGSAVVDQERRTFKVDLP